MASTTTKQNTPPRAKRLPSQRAIPQALYRWVLLRCYTYLRKYARQVLGAYSFSLAIILLTLIIPQLIRQTVDAGMGQRNREVLWLSVLGMLGLTLVKGVLTFYQGRWTEVASQGVAYDLRNALQTKLSGLSFSYHDYAQTGQLLTRAIQDVERIRFLTGRASLRLAESTVLLLGTLIALLLMNPRLALLTLASTPLLIFVAFRLGSIYRPLSQSIQQQLAELTTRLEQNLRGSRVVKAFAQEDVEIARFEEENARWLDLSLLAERVLALNMPLIDLIASLSTAIIIWYGGWLIILDQLTIGELVAFTTYLSQLISPIRRLGQIVPAMAMAAASGERIFEILDVESEVRDTPNAMPLAHVQGLVRFENVSFSYFGRHTVLKDLSFEAQPGQVIALLGATGSGKSTVINLIPRFYDPTAGCITIDGTNIRGVTLQSLRDQIGIVLQETTLFAATIRENIAFSHPNATETDIIAAAQAAQAHDFILETPLGYNTEVGERGITLSGGQKQRVAIARALLKDPRILILDDATSSVDSETERLIQLALERLMQGRTSFVIAQRLSTVRLADLVLVLEHGEIAARGTHTDLLQSSSLYAEIYRQQLKE
jgi:ATP-binding cassette, subfamily B, multidrug efflux pump